MTDATITTRPVSLPPPDLLHISASPRRARSRSSAAADRFLAAVRAARPQAKVDALDLWQDDLPRFDGDMIDAKYAVLAKQPHTPDQAAAWRRIEAIWRRFDAAPVVLFSIPMWNRSVPYVLKHYIDIVTQPGLAFTFTPGAGYRGLARPKSAFVIYASASDYGTGAPLEGADFQKPYFEHWLKFIGCERVASISVAPTMGDDRTVAEAMDRAMNDAERFGASVFASG